MGLTDPELELLRELLEEDPGAEVFVKVGEELNRRQRWGEAVRVLAAGLDVCPGRRDGWALFAEAALRDGQHLRAVGALDRLDPDPVRDPFLSRLRVLALERAGRQRPAREAALAFLELYPDDEEVQAARQRLVAPPPRFDRRAADPFVNVQRAEAYAAMGRTDRAVRAFRRILFHNPESPAIAARLVELLVEPHDPFTDDLSEELTDPGLIPPDLTMPSPALGVALPGEFVDEEITETNLVPPDLQGESVGDEEATSPGRPLPGADEVRSVLGGERGFVYGADADDEDAPTTRVSENERRRFVYGEGADEDDAPTALHRAGEGDDDFQPIRPDGQVAQLVRNGDGKSKRKRRSLLKNG